MRVVELFYSLQGEGLLAGVPSVFVRLAGCPYRCRWCDTAYAWEYSAGEELDPAQVVERIGQWECRFVVVTGGEPLMGENLTARSGLVDLTDRLRAIGRHVTIETTGTLFVADLGCDLMSISPKLGNSLLSKGHQSVACDVEALRPLMAAYPYQLKFVVESAEDVADIRTLLERLPSVDPDRVLLMPQARTREEMRVRAPVVAELCKDSGFRFCDRLHILLWGSERGR